MKPYLAEFFGTALLVLLGDGVVANVVLQRTKGHAGGWIVITAGWGCAVALAVYAVAHVSGAHLNPAVTLALAGSGGFAWSLVPGYIFSQMAGGFAGAVLMYFTYWAHWRVTDDPAGKLACFCTGPAVRATLPSVLTEVIGTAVLVFGVLALGHVATGVGAGSADWYAAVGTWFGPALVGLLIFAIGLSLGGPTGYALNPARDLAPRLAHALLPIPGKGTSDWSYAWIPVVAPIIGGFVGAWAFRLSGL